MASRSAARGPASPQDHPADAPTTYWRALQAAQERALKSAQATAEHWSTAPNQVSKVKEWCTVDGGREGPTSRERHLERVRDVRRRLARDGPPRTRDRAEDFDT